jgi:Gpi18-like mannosyltransferase
VSRLQLSDRARARASTWIALGVTSVLALALRLSMIHATNNDAELQATWAQFIRSHGGLHALKFEFSNYTPLYSYLLLIGDWLRFGASDLVVVKWGSIAADFACAAYVFRIVRLRFPQGPVPVIAYAVLLFTPTVAINSAYWGQIDMLWGAAIVACVYYLLVGRSLAAMVAFGIGIAAKQQAEFLAPALLVFAVKGRIAWRHFLAVPAVYFVLLLPAWIEGRSLWSLISIYWRQAKKFHAFTYNSPSVWEWIPGNRSVQLNRPAEIWSLSLILLVTFVAVSFRYELTHRVLVGLATTSVLFVPFVLPRMHDRYFFAADVLSIVLVFFSFRLFPVALLVQGASFFAYWSFLWAGQVFAVTLLTLANLIALAILFTWLVLEVRKQQLAGT